MSSKVGGDRKYFVAAVIRVRLRREFWESAFNKAEEVTFAELVSGFERVACIHSVDWGGLDGEEFDGYVLVKPESSNKYNTLAHRYLYEHWKQLLLGNKPDTIDESVVSLDKFIKFVNHGEYGDESFVEGMLRHMVSFRDQFKARIKFKLLKSLTGMYTEKFDLFVFIYLLNRKIWIHRGATRQ
jgi:hypothetical protein